jgi:flagellar protein FlaJ
LSTLLPYSIIQFLEFRRIKSSEREFPKFLRDLAEAKRSGLSLIQAINTCAGTDYGALTKEVIKLKNQLSWNIPLKIVLENFRKRFAKSEVISYATMVLEQVEESGGNTEDIMDSLADNIENLREAEEERKSLMTQHTTSMYAIFFIFVGITVAIVKFLTPLIQSQQEVGGYGGFTIIGGSPCNICITTDVPGCEICKLFFNICLALGFGTMESVTCYFKSLYFIMTIIQGIFSGLIIGQISSNSVIAGIKHSLILTLSSLFLFVGLSFIGVF